MTGKPDRITDAIRNNDTTKDTWNQGQEDQGEYFQMQLFIARLKNNLCHELMTAKKDTESKSTKLP